ncbi:MAG: tRNA pseudouridine(55) synthase TruB [Bdellovibrionales bacterium]
MPLTPASLLPHGWIALDKPLGLTSTQALGKARKILGGKKAGHGGTLDPLATGVLPLAFGEATKLIPYVMDGKKAYDFAVRWGETRDTADAEGSVIATSDARPSESAIRAALPQFVGAIMQRPPAYSAIKVEGQRAYDLARAGEAVELEPREVRIDSLELLPEPQPDSASFRVRCGKGMYVRALAQDLATALGTCGYVASLRRTQVGPFTLEQAVTIEMLEQQGREALQPLRAALPADMVVWNLTAQESHSLKAGQGVLIRPYHGALMDSGAPIWAEFEGIPVALVEPIAGEFRVLRGFCFT